MWNVTVFRTKTLCSVNIQQHLMLYPDSQTLPTLLVHLQASAWWSSWRRCGCPADSTRPARLHRHQTCSAGRRRSSASTGGADLRSTNRHWKMGRKRRRRVRPDAAILTSVDTTDKDGTVVVVVVFHVLDLLSWYVVQNCARGFLLRRNATVTRTSSKSETGHRCLVAPFHIYTNNNVDTRLVIVSKCPVWRNVSSTR